MQKQVFLTYLINNAAVPQRILSKPAGRCLSVFAIKCKFGKNYGCYLNKLNMHQLFAVLSFEILYNTGPVVVCSTYSNSPTCAINADELFVACLNPLCKKKKYFKGLWWLPFFPAWVTALALHNFSSERLLIHSVVLIWKGLMRENTYWLIIVLRKGHAFEMNEANEEGWGV